MVHIPVTLKFGSSIITLGYNLVKGLRDIHQVLVVIKSVFRTMGQLLLLVPAMMTATEIMRVGHEFFVTKMELGVNEVRTFLVKMKAIDLDTI